MSFGGKFSAEKIYTRGFQEEITKKHQKDGGNGERSMVPQVRAWRMSLNFLGLHIPRCSMYGIFTYMYHKDQPSM